MWMRLIKRLLLIGVLLIGSLGTTAFWAHRQTSKVPEFYERAIESPPLEDTAKSSQQLESDVEQFQADVVVPGTWQAEFAVDQVNAWLIEQLPKRFPTLQAKGLQEPRIMFDNGTVLAAARFKDHRLDAVFSCELSVQLTDQPNCLAVFVKSIRAGALPLPVSQFKDRIKAFLAKSNLNFEWDTRDGELVALIEIPSDYPRGNHEFVIIESIELVDQQLIVSGQTGDIDTFAFSPQGPIYKLAMLESESTSDD